MVYLGDRIFYRDWLGGRAVAVAIFEGVAGARLYGLANQGFNRVLSFSYWVAEFCLAWSYSDLGWFALPVTVGADGASGFADLGLWERAFGDEGSSVFVSCGVFSERGNFFEFY